MATSIRLKRVGAKKQASYRIVVIDSREGTAGASVERLGIYNPRTQPSVIKVNAARALHWLGEGAEPSDTVRSLFKRAGIWKQFHEGVTAEALEEEIVLLGPAPGAQATSQRPMPTDEAPAPEAGAKPAKKAKEEVPAAEEAEEAPAEEEDSGAEAEEATASADAREDVVVEPEPMTEAEPEVAEAKAEAEGGEPVAEAVETAEEAAGGEDAEEAVDEEPAAEAEASEEEDAREDEAEEGEETSEEPVAEAEEADEAEEAGEAEEASEEEEDDDRS